MRRIYLATVLLLVLFVTSSCKYHLGLTHNENHHQTQVVLDEKNYTIVKYVEGDATARYLFGVGGGASKRGIIARARENMLRNAGLLGKSRAVINETVELRTKQFLVFTEVRYIVSGYIVEFYNPEKETAPQAEENVYAEPEKPRSPNVHTNWVSAAYAASEAGYYSWNNYTTADGPGAVAGLRTEYSNPDIRFLFWETQLNLVYLNWKTSYNNRPYDSERSYGLELPLMAGLKFPLPINNNIHWFIKGGPFFNASLVNRKVYVDENWSSLPLIDNGFVREVGSLITLGAKIGTGFQIGQRWQLEFGHRFNIGWGEYDYTHFGVSYRL